MKQKFNDVHAGSISKSMRAKKCFRPRSWHLINISFITTLIFLTLFSLSTLNTVKSAPSGKYLVKPQRYWNRATAYAQYAPNYGQAFQHGYLYPPMMPQMAYPNYGPQSLPALGSRQRNMAQFKKRRSKASGTKKRVNIRIDKRGQQMVKQIKNKIKEAKSMISGAYNILNQLSRQLKRLTFSFPKCDECSRSDNEQRQEEQESQQVAATRADTETESEESSEDSSESQQDEATDDDQSNDVESENQAYSQDDDGSLDIQASQDPGNYGVASLAEQENVMEPTRLIAEEDLSDDENDPENEGNDLNQELNDSTNASASPEQTPVSSSNISQGAQASVVKNKSEPMKTTSNGFSERQEDFPRTTQVRKGPQTTENQQQQRAEASNKYVSEVRPERRTLQAVSPDGGLSEKPANLNQGSARGSSMITNSQRTSIASANPDNRSESNSNRAAQASKPISRQGISVEAGVDGRAPAGGGGGDVEGEGEGVKNINQATQTIREAPFAFSAQRTDSIIDGRPSVDGQPNYRRHQSRSGYTYASSTNSASMGANDRSMGGSIIRKSLDKVKQSVSRNPIVYGAMQKTRNHAGPHISSAMDQVRDAYSLLQGGPFDEERGAKQSNTIRSRSSSFMSAPPPSQAGAYATSMAKSMSNPFPPLPKMPSMPPLPSLPPIPAMPAMPPVPQIPPFNQLNKRQRLNDGRRHAFGSAYDDGYNDNDNRHEVFEHDTGPIISVSPDGRTRHEERRQSSGLISRDGSSSFKKSSSSFSSSSSSTSSSSSSKF